MYIRTYVCIVYCKQHLFAYVYVRIWNLFMHMCMILFIIVSANVGGMYTILSPVRDKWKDIGLKLGLFPATLENIDKFYHERTDQCLYVVLTSWLRRKDDVWKKGGTTWRTLIKALESVGADENVLATCRAEATASNQSSNILNYIATILLINVILCFHAL